MVSAYKHGHRHLVNVSLLGGVKSNGIVEISIFCLHTSMAPKDILYHPFLICSYVPLKLRIILLALVKKFQ